jgi:hypothetical protein
LAVSPRRCRRASWWIRHNPRGSKMGAPKRDLSGFCGSTLLWPTRRRSGCGTVTDCPETSDGGATGGCPRESFKRNNGRKSRRPRRGHETGRWCQRAIGLGPADRKAASVDRARVYGHRQSPDPLHAMKALQGRKGPRPLCQRSRLVRSFKRSVPNGERLCSDQRPMMHQDLHRISRWGSPRSSGRCWQSQTPARNSGETACSPRSHRVLTEKESKITHPFASFSDPHFPDLTRKIPCILEPIVEKRRNGVEQAPAGMNDRVNRCV